MCTSIVEIAPAEGIAKRGDEWFPLSQAVVAYDHAACAFWRCDHNTDLGPGARAGIELTLETGKELRAALDRAITAAEFEEAEVRRPLPNPNKLVCFITPDPSCRLAQAPAARLQPALPLEWKPLRYL
jgi:hypothetical protein